MPEIRPKAEHSIKLRIYEVRANGSRIELPLSPPGPIGVCGIEGCTCLGKRR
jgi:hypothetical protein